MNESGARNWLIANARGEREECEGGVKETGGQQKNGNRTECLCGRERVLSDGDGEIKIEMDRRGEGERL